MRIELEKVSKKFRREWVFKKVDLRFETGRQYAVSGPNGSGKSTLLKIISGHLSPSRGKVRFLLNEHVLETGSVYRHLSYAAPYIDLIEEFTLEEAIRFHLKFKALRDQLSDSHVLEMLGFNKATHKKIRNFSSGMKQRLKLVLAICSDTPVLLLDEPGANLDLQGIEWYRDLIDRFASKRLLIVASNVKVDFDFCDEHINMLDWK